MLPLSVEIHPRGGELISERIVEAAVGNGLIGRGAHGVERDGKRRLL